MPWVLTQLSAQAEVKHSRVAMLAAAGLIVQDLVTLPIYNKWYTGEKVRQSPACTCLLPLKHMVTIAPLCDT